MRDQTIALSAVYQAATMAHELANSGAIRDPKSWEVSLASLYKIDADSTEDVYDNNIAGLALGFNTLIKAFNKDSYYLNVMKYTITMLSLAAKLQQRPEMMAAIEKGLNDSKVLQNLEEPFNPSVVSKLAQIYSGTISQMQPRVIVAGQPFHLKDQAITEKIRAILLAGIRAAVLWKQVGGGQLQILLKRRTYIEEAKKLLSE